MIICLYKKHIKYLVGKLFKYSHEHLLIKIWYYNGKWIQPTAVRRPDLISELAGKFGSQCIVLAVDAGRHSPMAHGRFL